MFIHKCRHHASISSTDQHSPQFYYHINTLGYAPRKSSIELPPSHNSPGGNEPTLWRRLPLNASWLNGVSLRGESFTITHRHLWQINFCNSGDLSTAIFLRGSPNALPVFSQKLSTRRKFSIYFSNSKQGAKGREVFRREWRLSRRMMSLFFSNSLMRGLM